MVLVRSPAIYILADMVAPKITVLTKSHDPFSIRDNIRTPIIT